MTGTIDWTAVFKSTRAVVYKLDCGDGDSIAAMRGIAVASIEAALRKVGIMQDMERLKEKLYASGVTVVREESTNDMYVSKSELEAVYNSIKWDDEPEAGDIAEMRKAIDSLLTMVSEMYVPLVQKNLLRKIAERVGVCEQGKGKAK